MAAVEGKKKFYQDNGYRPTLRHTIAITKFYELRFELINHLMYSQDHSNFFLFPKLKVKLGRQRFLLNEKIIASIDGYFAEQDAITTIWTD